MHIFIIKGTTTSSDNGTHSSRHNCPDRSQSSSDGSRSASYIGESGNSGRSEESQNCGSSRGRGSSRERSGSQESDGSGGCSGSRGHGGSCGRGGSRGHGGSRGRGGSRECGGSGGHSGSRGRGSSRGCRSGQVGTTDEVEWQEIPDRSTYTPSTLPPFQEAASPTVSTAPDADPIDYFRLFISDDILGLIVKGTNAAKIEKLRAEGKLTDGSR